jgi:hypothetical protein
MNTLSKKGSMVMSLYCPFWMLNKTGVMLTYRVSWHTYVLLNSLRDFFFRFSGNNHLLIATANMYLMILQDFLFIFHYSLIVRCMI